MNNQQSLFKKKELVLAVSVAMFSGVMTGCSSSDGGPAAGAYTITAKGGNANNSTATVDGGEGGIGGEIMISNDGGTGGIEIKSSGKANTNFNSPVPKIKADTGANPLEVTGNTTVEVAELWDTPAAEGAWVGVGGNPYIGTDGVLRLDDGDGYAGYATDAEVADDRLYSDGNELYVASATEGANLAPAGTLYMHSTYSWDGSEIYAADGSAATADAAYTGISVAEGATLTLGLNVGGWMASARTSGDIENAGTITTANNATNRGALYLRANNYIASGTIDTSGTTDANYGGGVAIDTAYAVVNSGAINTNGAVDATGYGGYGGEVGLYSTGFVQNSGAINTSGATSSTLYGGGGGEVNMYAAYVENSGDINTSGGSSADGWNGYSANEIYMGAEFGTNNSGNLTANGGNGNNGGQAGYIQLETWTAGSTRNSGTITSNSGNGTAGYAGYKGQFEMYANGGEVINSGDINTSGGNGVYGTSHQYGKGASLFFETYGGEGATPPGDVIISGNIETNGGDLSKADGTGLAGYAGNIHININMDGGEHEISNQTISLLGYTDINTSGGDGHYAGYGRNLDLYASYKWDSISNSYKAGPVSNEANIIARGGNAIVTESTTVAYGGYGGNVYIETPDWSDSDKMLANTNAKVSNSGDIDTSGGTSYNVTWDGYSRSGYVSLSGYHGASNSGAITANGGNDTAADGGTTGYGGYAQRVEIWADAGQANNSGAITNNGGDGEYYGGYTYGVTIYGTTVKNTGDLSSNGGNADATVAMSMGANGGYSELFGLGVNAVTNSGSFSYSGGTGENEGEEGCVVVGLELVGNCNSGPI